jgi:hypothetical protein
MRTSPNELSVHDPAWAEFPAAWVMMQPSRAYEWLAALPNKEGEWAGVGKPVFVAFVLGCVVSLLATDRLTLRVVGPASVYACFVPLVEILALIAMGWKNRKNSISGTIGLFFTGHGPWILWMLGFGAFWSLTSPTQFFAANGLRLLLYAAGIAALWSGYIDFCFFRQIRGESRGKAMRTLVMHRAISWTLGFAIFGGGSLWPEIVRVLRL